MPTIIDPDSIIAQIDDVLSQMRVVHIGGLYFEPQELEDANHNITLASAAIQRLTPEGSAYRRSLESMIFNRNLGDVDELKHAATAIAGQLKALKSDLQKGYTQSIEELIHADLFGDFMEMAQHLLAQSYHIPSAVLIGSVLEESLRKLLLKAGVPIVRQNNKGENVPLMASALNDELKRTNIYNNIVHKQVEAWIAIRNKAGHGQYDEFSKTDVDGMYQGVLHFLNQHPA